MKPEYVGQLIPFIGIEGFSPSGKFNVIIGLIVLEPKLDL